MDPYELILDAIDPTKPIETVRDILLILKSLADAQGRLEAELERLKGIRFCGLRSTSWTATSGDAQFSDDAGTGRGFVLEPGQTFGKALRRVDERGDQGEDRGTKGLA